MHLWTVALSSFGQSPTLHPRTLFYAPKSWAYTPARRAIGTWLPTPHPLCPRGAVCTCVASSCGSLLLLVGLFCGSAQLCLPFLLLPPFLPFCCLFFDPLFSFIFFAPSIFAARCPQIHFFRFVLNPGRLVSRYFFGNPLVVPTPPVFHHGQPCRSTLGTRVIWVANFAPCHSPRLLTALQRPSCLFFCSV